MRALTVILVTLLVLGPHPKPIDAAIPQRLEGLALVNEDGSLSIGGTQVRLAGILIPQLGTLCIEDYRGTSCSDFNVRRRLERKISGFVHCNLYGRGPDGVAQGVCTVEGRNRFRPRQDLGAWLVAQGLAMALRTAPAEYEALQQVAKANRTGIWSGSLMPQIDDWGDDSRF
ncbi:MAG TPA: hypothetical protein VNS22_02150 [Geminicoccus sp.]|uniref:thermonuclease family protein n=1 Tax=Geminicoccus sp. TaxID=2024832 RepID=UPI002C83ACEA|nr:hypothetical protein [Geminicoccus sp.]HWL67165.1 hypothetical protein [Geminicoccus sp.]